MLMKQIYLMTRLQFSFNLVCLIFYHICYVLLHFLLINWMLLTCFFVVSCFM